MKALLAIFVALFTILPVSSGVLAGDKGETPVFNVNGRPVFYDSACLSKLQLPKNLPSDYVGLTHTIYQSSVSPSKIINKCEDVDPDCLSRERHYSWGWIFRALNPRLSGIMPLKENHQFRQSFGLEKILPARFAAGKDDVLFIHYAATIKNKRCDVQVIDWRDLTVLISFENLSKMDIADVVRQYLDTERWYCYASAGLLSDSRIDLGDGKACGKLQFKRQNGALLEPIEWYREGDSILFVLEKVGMPLVSLIYSPPNPEECYGGMPYEDPRPFLRFEKSNRRQIAEEHLKAKGEKKDI